MKTWAHLASLLALGLALGRCFLDFRFVPELLPHDASVGMTAGVLFPMVVLFVVWIWALVRSAQESRGWTIALIVLNVVINVLYLGLGTAVAFCPTPCRNVWPLMEMMVWANLVTGAVAAGTGLVALRRPG